MTKKPLMLRVPFPDKSTVLIEGVFPMSEDEWSYLMRVLDAMKPGLVDEPEAPARSGSTPDTGETREAL